jgi:outer membrane biosynthesis protein TonB
MKISQIELLQTPVEVCILRDGKPLMTQVFQHTPIRFGRILDNDIVLPFDGVSRHHCELRFVDGKWTLEDLKSLNGVEVNGERVTSATFDRLGEFELKPVTIQLKVVKTATASAISTASDDETQPEHISATAETMIGPDPQKVASKRLHAEKPNSNREDHGQPKFESVSRKKPMIDVNGFALMAQTHGLAEKAKARAVQMTVLWHDVLLSVDEFLPGEDLIIEINGIFLRFGRAGRDRTDLRCPTGTAFVDRPGAESPLFPNAPATWMADDGIKVIARYVPQSRLKASGLSQFVDGDLVDPLFVSGLVHGALAIATATVTVKTPAPPKMVPERIAKIITTPIQPPVLVPTPTPPMVVKATPTPAPTPQPVVKATPPVATPTPKPIARVEKQKPRPKIEKAPDKKAEKILAKKVAPKQEPKVARAEPLPKKIDAPPTPTPKPFNASSVGALKALSMLSMAPAPSTSAEKIIVRKYASDDHGSSNSPTPTTTKMMSDLPVSNNSAENAAANGMALATGKNAGYGTGGFSGKTGKRGVMGSVIGGATYAEPAKTEGLTREQVMKVVQKHQIKIQQCYERSLMDDPSLAGRAEFEWEITAKGSVVANSVAVKETNLKNGEKLIDCVKDVFAGMQFPSAKNGSTTTPTIGLPFGRL